MAATRDKKNTKNTPSTSLPSCPVGETDCEALQEIGSLKKKVAELAELVRTDSLTGVANFRYFMQVLGRELERTRRTGLPTTLVMLDIDHFKKVNDTWGHEVGNRALVHICKILDATLRKIDVPCRYGGEEFAIIMPDSKLRAGVLVAERLRERIASTPLEVNGDTIELRASFGVDTFTMRQSEKPEEFVDRVDRLLYQAKENGRNQVCHGEIARIDDRISVGKEEREALFGMFRARPENPSDD